MNNLKRLGLLAGILILLSTLMACPSEEGSDADLADDSGNLKFSWYVGYDWWSPPNAWGVDVVSAWLKENKKVDIEWVSPSGSGGDKLNLMIATGDLTDVICLDRGAKVASLIDAGLLLPLDPYLDSMPNLKKYVGTVNLELLRYKDGKLYQFPNWYISPDATSGNGNAGWAINTKVYKELGSPSIGTYDELEAYLEKVAAKFPDMVPLEVGDGFQAKTLVFRGMGEQLFSYMDNLLGTPKDGKFTKMFKDPNVRDTFSYLSRLMRKGLMTQDVFAQTRDQVMEKLVNGQIAVVTSWDFGNMIKSANDNNKIDVNLYDVIAPPHRAGIDGEQVTLAGYATLGWNVNVFTKNAEPRIKEILAYLDWSTGEEGQRALVYGPKGFFWDEMDENGIPYWNAKYENASDQERQQSRIFNWNWVGNTSWVDKTKVAANLRLPADKRDKMVEWQGRVLWKYVRNENEFAYDKPDPASDLGQVNTIIADFYDQALADALFASSDAEVIKILDQTQEEMDKEGYQKFLDYHNNEWSKRKALLQSLAEKAN